MIIIMIMTPWGTFFRGAKVLKFRQKKGQWYVRVRDDNALKIKTPSLDMHDHVNFRESDIRKNW